ncbi:MAG: alpha/beta hydrolase [Promethearchaeota archaeon]|nr:MAG: alpha/beta hydrolase [Candidatus Lokiarchaeota archaeon]
MTENFTEVNGIKICYEAKGDGYPLILIHGVGAKKETWIAQIKALSNRFKIIALDLRGTGKSDRPNFPYTMEMFVNDIKGLMDKLKIEKAHIAGRSMGGMVAQHFVLMYPQYVDKLILITTSPRFPDEEGIDLMIQNNIEELQKSKLEPIKTFWQKSRFLFHQKFRKEMKSNPDKKFFGVWSPRDLIKEDAINPPRAQDIRNQWHSIKKHDTFNRLSEIKHETLLITASHDRLTPKITMQQMNELMPNSQLKVIEKSGHYCHLSNANEFNQMILDFLEN